MHFKSLMLAVFVTFNSMSIAMAKSSSGQGLSNKNTSTYNDLYYLVLDSDANTPEMKSKDGDASKEKVLKEFDRVCKDNDSLDYVNWQDTKSDSSVVIFTCFDNYDMSKGIAFSFVIDSDKKIIQNLNQYEFSRQDSKKTPSNTLGIVVKEILALSASVGLTFYVVSEMHGLQEDKILHSTVSAVFAGAVASFSYHQLKLTKNQSALVGAITSCVLGAAVEYVEPYVKYKGVIGDRDIKDMGVNLVGCTIGAALMRLAFHFE